MILSAQQVIQLALDAGFTPQQAITATAIAHAESGFSDVTLGDIALETGIWGPSVGLWQIRTLKAEKGTGQYRDVDWLLSSPANQAKAAFQISAAGASFKPWSTFTNGAYLRWIPEAVAALGSITTESQQEDNMASTILGFSPTPTGQGYWAFFSDGAVFSFGDAKYFGRPQLQADGSWHALLPVTP